MNIFLLLVFWSLWFLNFSTRTVIAPVMPIIEKELVISHALAGSLFFSLAVGHTISVFMSGLLSLRIGYKRSICYSFLMMIIALFGVRYAGTYVFFALSVFFLGLGSGIYMPGAIPLITSIFRPGTWGKAISFHETAAALSLLAMPLLTVFLLRFLQWRSIFVVLGLACLLVNLVFWVFAPDPKPVEEKRSGLPSLLRRKDFWLMVIFWAFAAMSTAGLYSITPLFLVKERGLSLDVANTIFGISKAGGLFVIVLLGFVLDRCSLKKIMLITLLWAGLSTVGIAVVRNFWLLATLLFVQSTLGNALFPIGFVGISKLTDVSERSLFTGMTISVSAIMGLGVAPLALGTVADLWNFQAGILVLGVLTTLSCFSLRNLPEI